MNAQRRKKMKEQLDKMENLKNELKSISCQLDKVKESIQAIRDEEEMAYDNLPESIQDGEKGDIMQEVMGIMDSAANGIDIIIGSVNGAVSEFDDPMDYVYEIVGESALVDVIKLRMNEMGLTQAGLAKLLNVSSSRISAILSVKCEPTLKEARAISSALNINANIVLGLE